MPGYSLACIWSRMSWLCSGATQGSREVISSRILTVVFEYPMSEKSVNNLNMALQGAETT